MDTINLLPKDFINETLLFYKDKEEVEYLGLVMTEAEVGYDIGNKFVMPTFLYLKNIYLNDNVADIENKCLLLNNKITSTTLKEIEKMEQKEQIWAITFHGKSVTYEKNFLSKNEALAWFIKETTFNPHNPDILIKHIPETEF